MRESACAWAIASSGGASRNIADDANNDKILTGVASASCRHPRPASTSLAAPSSSRAMAARPINFRYSCLRGLLLTSSMRSASRNLLSQNLATTLRATTASEDIFPCAPCRTR